MTNNNIKKPASFAALLRELWYFSIKQNCPACKKTPIFKKGFTLDVIEECPHCTYNMEGQDSADGPAVFLIFILGFTIIPLALWASTIFDIPLWGHAIFWTIVLTSMCAGLLRPIKACVIYLNYIYLNKDGDET